MIPNIGPLEIIAVLVVVLLIFGPKRLPGLGRSLGSGLREFKESITPGRSSTERIADSHEDDETERDGARRGGTRADGAPEPAVTEPVGGRSSAPARDPAA